MFGPHFNIVFWGRGGSILSEPGFRGKYSKIKHITCIFLNIFVQDCSYKFINYTNDLNRNLFVWLIHCWLTDWSTDWLTDRLIDWLTVWLPTDQPRILLTDWLMFDWLNNTESFINWLADCLIGWFTVQYWQHARLIKKLTEYLLDRLIDRLTRWQTTCSLIDWLQTNWMTLWLIE